MDMDNQLEEQLSQLRQLVSGLGEGETAKREQINQLINTIEQRLDKVESDNDELHQSVISSLKESIEQFETSHPAITSSLNQIMVMLANMGI